MADIDPALVPSTVFEPHDTRTRQFSAARMGRLFRRRPAFAAGLVIILFVVLMAVFGPALVAYQPTQTNPRHSLEAPSTEFPFGTDKFGRDMLTRVVYATRLDLTIAVSVAMGAFVVGSLIGGMAGYYGGWLEDVIMRLADVGFAFPSFISAMAITGVLGDTVLNVIIAIAASLYAVFHSADARRDADRPHASICRCCAQCG